MEPLQYFMPLLFGATALTAFCLFYIAAGRPRAFLVLAGTWIIVQSAASLSGFYLTPTRPPRFLLLAGPPGLFAIIFSLTKPGRRFYSGLNLKTLTLLHTLRIPVELTLFWLYTQHSVPRAMTFEGGNFDIVSGLTAPVVYYFAYVRKSLRPGWVVLWNVVCLGLLLNVVTTGIGAALNGGSGALGHFPYALLPGCIVPVVLVSHVTAIVRRGKSDCSIS